MIKKLVPFLFFLVVVNVSAQRWVDSIDLARKNYSQKKYDVALGIYERNTKKTPKAHKIENEVAQSYYRVREFKKALTHYKSSLNQTKNKEQKSKIHHNIGNSKFKLKDYKGAIESYKNALKLNPNDTETRYNLSEALRRKNQQERKNPPKKDPKNNPPKPKKDKPDNPDNKSNPSPRKLPNKQVEKVLNDLAKQEGRTKRKMQKGNKPQKNDNISKDW
jgi:tetratricopeptide (TPR) repeat protein